MESHVFVSLPKGYYCNGRFFYQFLECWLLLRMYGLLNVMENGVIKYKCLICLWKHKKFLLRDVSQLDLPLNRELLTVWTNAISIPAFSLEYKVIPTCKRQLIKLTCYTERRLVIPPSSESFTRVIFILIRTAKFLISL